MADGEKNLLDQISNVFNAAFGKFNTALKDSFTNVDSIVDKMLKIDDQSSNIAKNFGVGRANIEGISKSLTNSFTDIALLGGDISNIVTIQEKTSISLGKNVLQNKEEVKSLYETYLVTGQEVGTLTDSFKTIGYSTSHISDQMNKVVDSSRKLGVSSQEVSKQAVANLSTMNQFNFANGVEGLAKMAAQAVSLRVNMSDTLGIAKKLFDPEQAIEMAASMQRLGVAQSDLLDPLRLMDLAQNDPTELQNQIAQMSKQFVQLGKDGQFEIMPGAKRQMMELSKELYGNSDTLSKMALSSFEIQDKMNKIKFPVNAFDEDQKNFIANMAQMGKDGKYEINLNGEKLGIDEAMDKFSKNKELLDKFMEDQKPKTIEDLAKEQLSTNKLAEGHLRALRDGFGYSVAGSKLGKTSTDVVRTGVSSASEIYRSLNPFGKETSEMTKNLESTGGEIINIAKDYFSDKTTLKDSFQKVGEQGLKLEEIMRTNLTEAFTNTGKEFGKLIKGSETLRLIVDKVKEKYKDILPKGFEIPGSADFKPKNLNTELPAENTDKSGKVETQNTNLNGEIKVEVNVTGDGIDETKFSKILEDSEFMRKLQQLIDDHKSNYGLTKK
jgi:hypothetical protein